MRQLQNFKIVRRMLPDHYGESLILKYRGVETPLQAGLSDDVYIYHDKEQIHVLSINYRLEYIGLESFDKTDMGQTGEIFLQSIDDDKWMLETSRMPTIIRYLQNYY